MNLPCTAQVFLQTERLQQYGGFFLLSFIAAVVLAPLVLYVYRRRVLRLMAGPANAGDAVMEASGPSRADEPDRGKNFSRIEALKLASRERATRLAWSLRIVALIFALVTVACALALKWQTASSALEVPSLVDAIVWPLIALYWTFLMLGMAWPTVILGTAKPRFGRWFILITLPCLLQLSAMPIYNSKQDWSHNELIGYAALLGLLVAICLGLIPRHMRNVVPVLTLCLILVGIVWAEANNLAGIGNTCWGWSTIHTRGEALRSTGFLVALTALMLATGIFGIYRLLRAVASAYRNKWFSDAQLQVLFWYIGLTFLTLAMYASQTGFPAAPGAPPLAVVVGVSILPTAIAYAWLTRYLPAPHRPSVTLLLLRVFGQTRRGERLLERLATSWRFIGPICMIGGPDLAKASLEPHKLAALLTGKLKQGFVSNQASLNETLARLDLEPDPDRRYRLNEVYCDGEIWTHAVRRLIDLSDVVLIDLREFNASRRGTATELTMLARLGALTRTIAVVGKATDLNAVRYAMSTPRSKSEAVAELRTASVEDRLDDDEFFAQVIAAAQPAREHPPLPKLRKDQLVISDPPPISEPSQTPIAQPRGRDWKWTFLQSTLWIIIVCSATLFDVVFWNFSWQLALLVGMGVGWILVSALPRALGRKFATMGITVPIIALGVGLIGYKAATLELNDDMEGLTGKARSAFVEAYTDVCAKQSDNSFSPEIISQYCRCYANGMADRLSNNEVMLLYNMKQAEELAPMQPKMDAAADACQKWLAAR